MRPLFSLAVAAVSIFGYGLESLSKEPSGYARDLFLLRFMEQNISKEESFRAYFLTKTPKAKHSSLLLKKSGSKKLGRLFDCMDSNLTRALQKSPECAELGVNYKKISGLILKNSDEPDMLAQKIIEHAPSKAEKLKTMLQIASNETTLNKDTIESYFDSSKEFRGAFFDIELSDEEAADILSSKHQRRFIKWVLFDKHLQKLQTAIAQMGTGEIEDSEALFFLGLIKIKNGHNGEEAFRKSSKTAAKDSDRDRANFWAYLASKKRGYLFECSKSRNLNFYSLLASEMMGQKRDDIDFISVEGKNQNTEINKSSPFYWQNFRDEVRKYQKSRLKKLTDEMMGQKDGEAYYLYAREKLEGYKKNYFLLPYKEIFDDYNSSQKLLMHAIGRQESLFVPTVVSSAYAVGVMQIIPILADELAAKRGEKIDFFELFEPKKNIAYASTHFKWLESRLYHPTLIAVAFNAGYGFFKRVEREDGLFVFEDKETIAYEPFWSIENIPYDETREYAKKVSLNYVVYSEVIGEKTTLNELLKNLVSLRRSRF